MSNYPDLKFLLDKLPPFIQKGDELCKLIIKKDRSYYVMQYNNATRDLLDHDSDLTALAFRMLQKLHELEGSKGYKIDWDFW